MSLVGGREGCGPLFEDLASAPKVDIGGGEQGNAGVPVLAVVPAEKASAKSPGLVDRGEAFWELRAVFEGFELGLGVGLSLLV
jgi:hypothetical protein